MLININKYLTNTYIQKKAEWSVSYKVDISQICEISKIYGILVIGSRLTYTVLINCNKLAVNQLKIIITMQGYILQNGN